MNCKPLFLLLALAAIGCSTLPSHRSPDGVEFTPGTFRLSGDVGYSSNGNGSVNGNATQLGGSLGYFLTPGLEMGLGGDYEKVNRILSGQSLENTFLSIFARYYTTTVGSTRPFAELSAGMGTTSFGVAEEDLRVLAGTMGFLHFLSDTLAVEVAVEKTFYAFPNSSTAIDTDSWSGSVGLSWFF